MSELRKDPILGRWVIISTERAARPNDFPITPPPPMQQESCPFCVGNESMTPPSVLTIPKLNENGDNWRVRVVSNKYPALRVEGDLEKSGMGLYDRMSGVGAHEVIIETSRHVTSLSHLSEPEVQEVLTAYRSRMIDLKQDKRFNYGMLFKNVGQAAGASVTHTHSQLIVLPTIPKLAREEMDGAKFFYDYRGRCLFCDMIEQELESKERIVEHNDQFVAFTPFASRFPFETWVLPRNHYSHFENISDSDIESCAEVLRSTIRRLESTLSEPSYNYMIHTTPFSLEYSEYYHWHIEIIPRLTRVAGFEWGTDFYINPVPPEDAARFLREAGE